MLNKILCLALLLSPITAVADDEPGHSAHGSAFDSGMRTKPWLMPGIGNTPFPITSKNKEVQQWFDQGEALLHSFWFEEAERSFRWCLKLDPNCAMAYWGLARCGFTWFNMDSPFDDKYFDRYKTFLKEAVNRKDQVSERERMYIEAWQYAVAKGGSATLSEKLEGISTKFPDDIEAKALLALFNIGRVKDTDNENIIQQVLAKNPLHPGALHASIHNWDGSSPLQAIKSSEVYGKAAPGIGHALHMPGHIFAKIGMWREAAIAMDSATRTELKYMNDRLALPFETWNFSHNRNYLCYIQEQLGMADVSIQGAKDLIAAPREPEGGMNMEGMIALMRGLIKFERAKEIMTPGFIEWGDGEPGKYLQALCETLAHTWQGDLVAARTRFKELQSLDSKIPGGPDNGSAIYMNVAEGLLLIAEGKVDLGEKALMQADELEKKVRKEGHYTNDPPDQPWPVARLLGDHFRKRGFKATAIAYYNRALANEPNDAFTLGGLALTYAAAGDMEQGEKYAGRLAYVWANADPNLPLALEVRKRFPNAKPIAEIPDQEREYVPASLDFYGPSNWQPFPAPRLEVLNINGKPVHLEDYRGKNILLVFFLGEACVHCVGQLKSINDRIKDFESADTVVFGVCSASPQALKDSVTLNPVKIKFLSDTNHENARRFASYDDFEEIELHSTILIDKQGKVRWKRTGGDPFMDMDFLLRELKRVNKS